MHAVPKAHLQRGQVRYWSWIWAAVTAELQAQAQNLMHWIALGFGLGIAAILGLLLRPEALLGPGFQKSFAATGLLIIVFNGMSQWTWVARW